ncbi:NAD-dependent epimerase/dehydratase family protein [Fundicoccus culcitae]|uniref:NAD-dependent epimerase/dehydratase family protein n=1 Tax=Fundicoccus culcitae TaxID=2969821 RepID=A0ABY5P6N2_9LACT|nr:NAD-dependent epimerase/dehydratase family protein [Fundicoccus culcitae]UUX34339.1 NAD-dependent epimerase/dehydratase family protein [Fundicoccus culcitae]
MKNILVTGALGQIGTELVSALRQKYGEDHVIASDLRVLENHPISQGKNFEILDVMDYERFKYVAKRYEVDTIIHLAALLSAVAEAFPKRAWEINMTGLVNGLEVARELNLQFFTPSSIGAFGPNTPKINTPQVTIQRPSSMYGVTKVAGELLCDYYFTKFGVDTRSMRFPGLISYVSLPGGGTTDYAVDIFYEALRKGNYECFLSADTRLDMMYMDDAVQAVIDLNEAEGSRLLNRNAYNVSGMSITPAELAKAIQEEIPAFEISYKIDPVRQGIADSWPDQIDCQSAKDEWGFNPQYTLESTVKEMLSQLNKKLFVAVE